MAAGLSINSLAVYEVPYDIMPGALERHREYTEKLRALLAEGRRGDAFAHAMWTWGASGEEIERAKQTQMWPGLEDLAHTWPYDADCMGTNRPPAGFTKIAQPTLVLTGDISLDNLSRGGIAPDFFGRAADTLHEVVPNADRRIVEGQGHVADPAKLAPILGQFFTAREL